MSDTELRVVCRECGSEVSPYVTECPYCGARVRKRAPELEHHDDHFEAKLSPRRRLRIPFPRIGRGRIAAMHATGFSVGLYVVAATILMLVATVADFGLARIGAVSGPLDGQWWRLATAPFAYDNVGYLFAVAVTLAIFGTGIERRLGPVVATFFLLLAGIAGTGGGYLVALAMEADGPLIAGGNSVALGAVIAWLILRWSEARRGLDLGEPPDLIGVGVVICALLLLPLVETSADVFAGLAGAAFGAFAGLILAGLRRA